MGSNEGGGSYISIGNLGEYNINIVFSSLEKIEPILFKFFKIFLEDIFIQLMEKGFKANGYLICTRKPF